MIDLPHHLARDLPAWTLTVRTALTGEVTLDGAEACDLAAAIELDRVQRGDAVALLTARRMTGQTLMWDEPEVRRRGREQTLVDGAHGLRREDAPGYVTIAALLARVGVQVTRCDVVRPVDMAEVKRGLRAAGGAR